MGRRGRDILCVMRIREATEADVPVLTEIYRWAVEETVATFSEDVHTQEQRREWMLARQQKGYPVLVAEGEDGTFLGFASYDQFRPASGYRFTVEHSVYVSPDSHGGGVGSSLLTELLSRARAAENVWAIVATIEGDNVASLKLHEKFGFTEQGRLPGVGYKFGRRLDLVYLQLDVAGDV